MIQARSTSDRWPASVVSRAHLISAAIKSLVFAAMEEGVHDHILTGDQMNVELINTESGARTIATLHTDYALPGYSPERIRTWRGHLKYRCIEDVANFGQEPVMVCVEHRLTPSAATPSADELVRKLVASPVWSPRAGMRLLRPDGSGAFRAHTLHGDSRLVLALENGVRFRTTPDISTLLPDIEDAATVGALGALLHEKGWGHPRDPYDGEQVLRHLCKIAGVA